MIKKISYEKSNRLNKAASWLIMSVLLLVAPIAVAAQAVSGVTGVVTDANGALVPGVQVTLADTKTASEQTVTTNDQGVYTFNNIKPGPGYRLTFIKDGFQTSVINEVQLGIGRVETQNTQLLPGQVSGVVTVTSVAGEATLNTTDASVGNVISERQIRELPILIRDSPAALIGLQPGVIGNNVGTGATNRVGSVTGSRADQGNITVDGIDSNDQATGQAFVTVGNLPIDSVQEFRAITTNPGAADGRSSGGQIQLATKSGNNNFHGSLREFWRGDQFAANSFFNNRNGIERPGLQRHQFGGTLSGPLPFFRFGQGGPAFSSGKDKLFFFFDYEGRRDNSETAVSRTVPLQNLREGRIGYINNNAGCTFTSRQDTTPNCISYLTQAQAAALDPQGVGISQALLSFINSRYPAANDVTGGNGINTGLYRYNAPVTLSKNTYTPRVDWNITKTQRLFMRATLTDNNQTNSVELFPGDGDSVKLIDKSYQLVAGHTWVINPSFTNQATVGVSRQKWDFPVASSPAFPNSFNGGGVITSPFSSQSFQNRDVIVPTLRDDVTLIKGSHTFTFGAQFKPTRQKSVLVNDFNFVNLGLGGGLTTLDASLRPANILSTSSTARSTYDSAFTFLLGRFASISSNFVYDTNGNVLPNGSGRAKDYAYNEYEFYVQDNWKVRSDLTLNLGLRYYLYPAPYEKNGFQSANDVDFDQLLALRVANAAAGIAGPSAEPFLKYNLIGAANNGRPLYQLDKNNFSPRVGFAYNPSFKDGIGGFIFGNRKTSIRGGASIVYDRVGGAITFIQDQLSYLFDSSASTTFGSLDARASLLNDPRFAGLTTLPVQNTAPSVTAPVTPFVSGGVGYGLADGEFNYVVAQNFEIPYSYQWSLGFQREMPGNFILEATYVGRRGKKLLVQSDAAQTLNFKDATSGQLMYDAFNAVQAELNNGVAANSVTPQPWIENQLGLAVFGTPACGFCTAFVARNFTNLLQIGDASDLVQALYFNGLLRPNVGMSSQFAVNAYITNQGSSQYDGLLVSLRKRFSKGFQFDANYTWSHGIDNQSNVTNTVTGALVYDIVNLQAGRGNADFDIRHLFNANAIWDLPFGRGRAFGKNINKVVDAFVGGWTLSGIFTARSGFVANSSTGSFPVGFFTNSPAVLTGDTSVFTQSIHDEGTGIQFFSDPAAVLAALRYPHHGESGNRNLFRSPGFFELDMLISKKFKMPWSETHRLTFRAEAYNVTNTNFFTSPDLTLNSTTFGRITGSQSTPRQLQFALRYDF